MAGPTTAAPEWLRLQRKIFSRWANQKLWMTKHIKVDDIVEACQTDPTVLLHLVEVLTEKPYTGKPIKLGKMRVQLVAAANEVLNYIYASGVQMKIKTSAEDLINGDEKNVLALVFSILLKFMKIGDDEDGPQLSAKDALLMWVQNKTAGYEGVSVTNFTTSFHSGLALCALIHKFRPQLVDYASLKKDDKLGNLKIAMDAAEKYFGLEQYLTPQDVLKLDECGMLVYVSEYFYGIAEQRKIDQAARRIQKVVKFTKTTDAMRAEFADESAKFLERLKKVEAVLEDRTIDNTMAGAKRKLEEFYKYKTEDKNVIMGYQLNLESLYNNLSMLLVQNKRPEFVPPAGLSLKDIEASMLHLEQVEQERKVALHAELNRQIRLVKLDEHHQSLSAKLEAYAAQKLEYLAHCHEHIESIGAAQFALKALGAFDKESSAIRASQVEALLRLGAELAQEHYERTEEVQTREAAIVAHFDTEMAGESAAKRPILDDHLARELFKEELRLKGVQHSDRYKKLHAWCQEKEAYLAAREDISSISDAQLHLRLLDAFDAEFQEQQPHAVEPLKALGQEILNAEYKTEYSAYTYDQADELREHELTIDDHWTNLAAAAAEKRRWLDDSLAREQFKEELRMQASQHHDRYEKLSAWCQEKEAYLAVREEIGCVADAQMHLRLLDAYDAEQGENEESAVAPFKDLGQRILGAEYKTDLSEYRYHLPDDITTEEANIDQYWAKLSGLSGEKRQYLDTCLAREQRKEELRVAFAEAADDFTRFANSSAESLELALFGFTLEEVEKYAEELQASTATITASLAEKKDVYTRVWADIEAMGFNDNPYTTLTVADLAASEAALTAALEGRQQRYDAELARQRANDALCLQFAQVADPLAQWVLATKDTITRSKDKLRDQLAFVEGKIASVETDGAALPNIVALQAQMDEAGITNNRHTLLTAKDCEVLWAQYTQFLDKKKKMLETEIENEELRGITAEQMAEIESNFKQFDKDAKGKLDQKQLKACLYSLGEEVLQSEIQKVFAEYAPGADGIDMAGFKRYMIHLLGDTDSKDDVLAGWALIAKGEPVVTLERLELTVPAEVTEYIQQTAPQKDSGYDYTAWTEDVFSR